jgi:hypothetical protein
MPCSCPERCSRPSTGLDAGQVVSVERLTEGLWGDQAPADALNALRHHVSRLRQMIGPSLVTPGPGYLLAVKHKDVDALQFASWRARRAHGHLRRADAVARRTKRGVAGPAERNKEREACDDVGVGQPAADTSEHSITGQPQALRVRP